MPGRTKGCSRVAHIDGCKSNNSVRNLKWTKIEESCIENPMADSLVLKGVKGRPLSTLAKETVAYSPSSRGGDTHKIKEWWHGTNGAQYCTLLAQSLT